MSRRLRSVFVLVMAILMVSSSVAAASPSLSRVSPQADDAVGLVGYDVPNDVVKHGQSPQNPGIFVSVESDDDLSSLESWSNSSEDRLIIERYNDSNTYLIAAPMTDVATPTVSTATLLGGETTISELDYVTGWDFDRTIQRTDPISNLDTSDAYEQPDGALWARANGGELSADSLAYSDDAPNKNVTQVRKHVGADTVSADGTGVNVAVIDSGCSVGDGRVYGNGSTGSDIRISDGYDYVDGESVDVANDSYEALDDPAGHGSWVSSAVAGADGIAPNSTLMCYRTLNSEGKGSTSDIVAALDRADRKGADVAVMSLGSPVHSDVLAQQLRAVLGENGNLTGVFVAAGNSYSTTRWVSSPGDVDKVITVSATNAVNASNAKKANFANVGPDSGVDGSGAGDLNTRGVRPDTAAPGMNITTTVFTPTGGYSKSTLSGTSMATPIAAGVGVLLLDAEESLEGQPTEFRDRLVNSGSHTPQIGVTESVGGMVNADRAINGYSNSDAPDRDLNDETQGTDTGNRALSGNVGVQLARISDTAGGVFG